MTTLVQRDVMCPLCGCPASPHLHLEHTTVCRCSSKNCGLQFAFPQPNEETLTSFYSELYYPSGHTAQGPQFENTPELTLRDLFRQLEKHIGGLAGLSLLDYGCGRGGLVSVANELGMQVAGIEPDRQARAVAASTGFPVYSSVDQLRQVKPGARFDAIVMWTVIEHLRAPWVELSRLRSLLHPRGWLLVSTMDIRCLRARVEGRRWENYENPTHLFYFDRISLEQTIRQAGFTNFSEWRIRLNYPQHGFSRRLLYKLSFSLRISDGLFFLCRASEGTGDNQILPAVAAFPASRETPERSVTSDLSRMKSES